MVLIGSLNCIELKWVKENAARDRLQAIREQHSDRDTNFNIS